MILFSLAISCRCEYVGHPVIPKPHPTRHPNITPKRRPDRLDSKTKKNAFAFQHYSAFLRTLKTRDVIEPFGYLVFVPLRLDGASDWAGESEDDLNQLLRVYADLGWSPQ